MSGEKRPAADAFGTTQLVKRQRSAANLNGSPSNALTKPNGANSNHALVQGTSSSPLPAPVMELTGHSGEIFSARFSPDSRSLASGSADRNIQLWRTSGECENYGILSGHKSAVLDLSWSRDSGVIYSASADHTLASWDAGTGQRIRRHVGHEEVVNCLSVAKRGEEFLVSGSDDGYAGVWDPRAKQGMDFFDTGFPVTAVCLAEAGNEVYTGGIENVVKVWDLRTKKVSYELRGHTDTVTSLELSPDTQNLLSYSHDSTVRMWDVRPFAPADRLVRTFDGAQVGLEKNLLRASWDPEGKRVLAGGGDGTVTVWDAKSGKLLHKLPGHRGTVNDVRVSPSGGLVLSASTDRRMLLGEMPR